jgi:hypothetical protein
MKQGITMPISIRYHFRTLFAVSAKNAFEWCTAFDPADHALMGEENAQQKIKRVGADTIILTDTFHTEKDTIEKQKLIELFPDTFSWTSTHLTGPNKHSQFLYQIYADGKTASHLDFIGLHLEYQKEQMDKAKTTLLTKKLCKEDACVWQLLAKAMVKDLSEK